MRRGVSLSTSVGSGESQDDRRRYSDDLEGGGHDYGSVSYGNNVGSSEMSSPLFRPPPGGSPYLRSTTGSTAYNNNLSSEPGSDGSVLDTKFSSQKMNNSNDGYDSKQKHNRSGRRRYHGGGYLERLQYYLLQSSESGVNINDSLFHNTYLQIGFAGGYLFLLIMSFMLSIQTYILLLVLYTCVLGIGVSSVLAMQVFSVDDGTPEMRAVSVPIREGAAGFLKVQYTAIAKFSAPLAAMIFVSYQFRPTGQHSKGEEGIAVLGNLVLGVTATVGFALGAVCSAGAGYLSMWVAASTNIRVASASRRSFDEALVVCFRGGAFSAVLNLTFCIAGVTLLYAVLNILFAVGSDRAIKATEIPMLMVGYGFGSSFVGMSFLFVLCFCLFVFWFQWGWTEAGFNAW
jgi:Inorganic H+ pyrophosphatase